MTDALGIVDDQEFTKEAVNLAASAGIRVDGWKAPTGASAIERGRQRTWEAPPKDGFADGWKRLGTSREVLSWPGVEPYLVHTEEDEARAQARLKKQREELRQEVWDRKKAVEKAARAKRRTLSKEWNARQADFHAEAKDSVRNEKELRKTTQDREAQIRSYYETAEKDFAALSMLRSSPRSRSRPGSPKSPKSPPTGGKESPA